MLFPSLAEQFILVLTNLLPDVVKFNTLLHWLRSHLRQHNVNTCKFAQKPTWQKMTSAIKQSSHLRQNVNRCFETLSWLQPSSWARRLAASWAVNRHWYLSSTALNSWQPCPRCNVRHPCCLGSTSTPGAGSCALHDFFFQAVSFLPHYMPKVHKLPLFNRRK